MSISKTRRDELEAMPSHEFMARAMEELNVSAEQVADLLGVAPQTVWRWSRDPAKYADSSRNIDPTARRVLIWMMEPGRPACWPAPSRDGWPIMRSAD